MTSPARTFFGTAALAAAVAAAAIARHGPPAPLPADAPPERFSAGRAREILRRLVGNGAPHPIGSAENARVRAEVARELTRLGYETTVQERFVCGSRYPVCATVANVAARLPGRSGRRTVLLAAHHDSVEAGPGASDDGMGVAALLEAARVLRADPPARNPVVLLVDDGEEAGLLGADAFTASHSWAKDVGAVVNVDARGTGGASLLFETSDDNAWLIAVAARALPRPNTSSVYYTIYKWLPNDTDLTIFRAHGLPGVNFAHIEGVKRYHTPVDDFAHASPATLQHHGDNLLAMARGLAAADLEAPRRGNAVFFDVFSAAIVRWPEAATLPLAFVAALTVAAALAAARRREGSTLAAAGWGLLAAFSGIVLAGAAAFGAERLARAAGAHPTTWVAHPAPFLAAVWALALAGVWLPAALLSRRAGAAGIRAGAAVLFAGAAIGLAAAAPGLAFLFLVPALAAGVAGLFGFPRAGAAAAAAAAAFFWIPMAWVLYDALGGAGAAGVGIEVAAGAVFAGAPFAALDRVLRRRILAALAAVAAVGLLAARLVSPSSADAPQAVNLSFRADGDAGTARWLVRPESGRLPRELRALGLAAAPVVVAPWSGRAKGFAASADGSPALPPPKLDVLEDRREGERRTIRARVRSPRGASEVFFAVAPQTALERFAIEGRVLPPPRPADLAARGGWRYFVCATVPPSGIEVELVANGGIELHYGDVSSGLPPEGARLLRARPPDAAPVGSGDATVVARRAPF